MKKWSSALLALVLVVLPAVDAHADAWFNIRKQCRPWAKKYTSNAVTACHANPVPRCYQHQGHCEVSSASCGWSSCLIGGAKAWASNGQSGFSLGGQRQGMGAYGFPAAAQGDEKSTGTHDLQGRADFDEATRSVTLSLERSTLSASADALVSRYDFYVFREDIKDGQEVDEPVRTAANTLWHGSIVLQEGRLTVEGFDPRLFKITKDRLGNTTVSFSQVKQVLKFAVSAADFENLVVQTIADGNSEGK